MEKQTSLKTEGTKSTTDDPTRTKEQSIDQDKPANDATTKNEQEGK